MTKNDIKDHLDNFIEANQIHIEEERGRRTGLAAVVFNDEKQA